MLFCLYLAFLRSWLLSSLASLQKGGGKQHTKVIKMVKSPKSGSYTFKEEIVHNDRVKDLAISLIMLSIRRYLTYNNNLLFQKILYVNSNLHR